ncbi:MAG: hypothetical protein KF866_05790 [Phycisphaeraceae bacterium]|nr:hypothetical protein [Phycisphaeraceae bacterium]
MPLTSCRRLLSSALVGISVVLAACAHRPASGPGPSEAPLGEPALQAARPAATPGAMFAPLPWRPPTDARLASGVPGHAYWQNTADYVIAVELDAEHRRLSGRQVVTYTNHSPDRLDYIWVHLEQNLFHPMSKGARLTRPGGRFGNRDDHEGGLILGPVVELRTGERPSESRPAPNDNRTLVQPETVSWQDLVGPNAGPIEPAILDMNVFDTVGRIDLAEPLQPGGIIRLAFEFTFEIPAYGSDRLGIERVEQGTIFQIAQWFPAICKYDDVHGWNHLPYLGQGEFFTDFGTYEVFITVPRNHLVAATGVLQNEAQVLTPAQTARLEQARRTSRTVLVRSADEVGDPQSRPAGAGPLTWHFKAHDVRTFAWASSEAFIWDAATVHDSSVRTLVHSFYPAEALPLWGQSTDMLRFAIEGYNARWFEYPYPTAINVNGIVGGMEYPMIVFCRERRNERGLYGVTTHEIGHNWFPMIVNTDEKRYAWMDEGLTTFINYYSTLERYPDDEPRRGNARPFVPSMLRDDQQPLMTPSDQVRPGALGMLMYAKTAVGLVMLREYILGPERFDFAFRRYIREWAFKSPQPEDFFRCMQDASGEDLTWFWRGWFYETGLLDQAVTAVEPERDRAGNPTGDMLVTFENLRELVMPLEYDVFFADGSVRRHMLPVEAWYTTNRWVTRVRTDGRTIVRIIVDPRELLPDINPDNNVWEQPVVIVPPAP